MTENLETKEQMVRTGRSTEFGMESPSDGPCLYGWEELVLYKPFHDDVRGVLKIDDGS